MDAIVLFSGGLDSTVLLAKVLEKGKTPLALSFDYGQRHRYELTCAEKIAEEMGIAWKLIKLDPATFETDYRPDDLPETYIPARNTLFISYALAFAETLGAREIYFGPNFHDREGYPDTTPSYAQTFHHLIQSTTRGEVSLLTPLIDLDKKEIVKEGERLGAPMELSSSCYFPEEDGTPCNACDACRLRRLGFQSVE